MFIPNKIRQNKPLLLTTAIVAGGFMLLQIMGLFAAEPPEVVNREPEFSVRVIEAQIGANSPYLSVIGTVEAQAAADLISPIESSVLELSYEEGERIQKDESVVVLDTRDLQLQIDAQQANIDDIKAQIESLKFDQQVEQERLGELRKLEQIAATELERTRKLRERGIVSTGAVDQAQAAASGRSLEILSQQQKINTLELSKQRLEAQLRGAQAQIGLQRLTFNRALLRAPWDGVVKEIMTTSGTDVQRGTALASIYDPASVRLRTAIPSSIAAAGQAISGNLTRGDAIFELELISVAPEAKQGRGSSNAFFSLPEGNWLLGTAIEFDLVLPAVANSVALPTDALYGGSRIYVIGTEQRAQAVSCSNLGFTRVESSQLTLLSCPGLKSGDLVVVNRIPNLVSGSKLRFDRQPESSAPAA